MASSPVCHCRSLLSFTSRLRAPTSAPASLLSSTRRLRAPISTSVSLRAGHNKWSKIRHEKGAADRKRGKENIILAKAITNATRKGGPDKNGNPALATAIAAAKAANATNDFIARAVARGQSREQDASGLERLTLEAVMPGGVALLLDVETDSRLRSLQDLNALVRKSGGKPGSTLFYFEHCGRVAVERGGDEVVDAVIEESGVLDFDVSEGSATVWTEAAETGRVAGVVRERCGVEAGVDLMWRAREDMGVALDSEAAAHDLADFLGALHEFPEVTASYTNAVRGGVSEETWDSVQESLIAP